jgi:3-phenylpropionate/trans-cinnamate dioxygenase ferredoxin subunit
MDKPAAQKSLPHSQKTGKRFAICPVAELPPGTRKIVEVDGKSIGLFNVKGDYYALLNYCPHSGAELCRGPITGTALPVDDFQYIYGYEGELIRCAWHGWEFKIATGECLLDPKIRAKRYQVTVEADEVVVHI